MSPESTRPIVAELGRPETPLETLERKEAASKAHRDKQTFVNLASSLLVVALLAFAIWLLVPRADKAHDPDLDYRSLASEAQKGVDEQIVVPEAPEGWQANAAELRGSSTVTEWYTGFIVPKSELGAKSFAAYTQGMHANPTWLAQFIGQRQPTGTAEIGGRQWHVYDSLAHPDDWGNAPYLLETTVGDTSYLVYGTGRPAQVEQLAQAIAEAMPATSTASAKETPHD